MISCSSDGPKKPKYEHIHTSETGINKLSPATEEAVISSFDKLKNHNEKSKKFLENTDVYIFSNYDGSNIKNERVKDAANSLSGFSSYFSAKGFSISTLEDQPFIAIQESGFLTTKFTNLVKTGSYNAQNEIKHTTYHEIGHLFDHYINEDANPEIKEKADKIEEKYANFGDIGNAPLTENEINTYLEYMKQDEFSDSDIYENAYLKDINNIENNEKLRDLFKDHMYFYTDLNFNFNGKYEDATIDDVEKADHAKSETFAHLFAYALNEDDGNRDEFLKLFPNTYNLVKEKINEELAIESSKFNLKGLLNDIKQKSITPEYFMYTNLNDATRVDKAKYPKPKWE